MDFVSARVRNLSFVGKCCLLRHFLLPLVEGNDLFKLTLPTSPSSRDGNTNLEIGWKRGRDKPVCYCALHGSSFLPAVAGLHIAISRRRFLIFSSNVKTSDWRTQSIRNLACNTKRPWWIWWWGHIWPQRPFGGQNSLKKACLKKSGWFLHLLSTSFD